MMNDRGSELPANGGVPLVSVLIITYNQIEFIHETLRSALDQDYSNLEVIVADDGSTDGTTQIILDYARKHPGRLVPLVGGPNLGVTGNSNRGLHACKGRYVALQGGDDVLLPGKIAKQVEWLEQDENRVLCGHAVNNIALKDGTWSAVHTTTTLRAGKGAADFVRHGSPFAATAIMVRRSAIPAYGFDERLPMVSDWKLWIDCLRPGGEYGFIEGVYALYRVHDAGVMTARRLQCYYEAVKTMSLIEEEYPELRKPARHMKAFRWMLVAYAELKSRHYLKAMYAARHAVQSFAAPHFS